METADSPALLVLDLPPAALVGIDLLSFTSTPKFKGIKNIPPGWHFIFVGSSTAFSERHGIWFEIPSRPKQASSDHALVITKWDRTTETLLLVTDAAETLHHRANLGSLWREGLAPYRQQAAGNSGASQSATDATQEQVETSDWPALTSAISSALLARITPTRHLSSASSSKVDLEAIPGITTADLTDQDSLRELHFLPINLRQTWRDGATGRERTEAAQDRSWALENLIMSHCTAGREGEVVGELQFCFLMILTLNNFSALEQWKRNLGLLLTCQSAVPRRPDLFISALAALRLQLQHCKDAEAGLIDLSDEGGSLLKNLLVRFRRGLEALGGDVSEVEDVRDELADLEDFLRSEHGWQFGGAFAKSGVLELEDGERVDMETTAYDEEDETGEFAPVMVELSAEERRALGVGDDEEVGLRERLSKAALGSEKNGLQLEEASSGSEDEDDEDEGNRNGSGARRASSGSEQSDWSTQDISEMDMRY